MLIGTVCTQKFKTCFVVPVDLVNILRINDLRFLCRVFNELNVVKVLVSNELAEVVSSRMNLVAIKREVISIIVVSYDKFLYAVAIKTKPETALCIKVLVFSGFYVSLPSYLDFLGEQVNYVYFVCFDSAIHEQITVYFLLVSAVANNFPFVNVVAVVRCVAVCVYSPVALLDWFFEFNHSGV